MILKMVLYNLLLKDAAGADFLKPDPTGGAATPILADKISITVDNQN